MEEQCIVSNKEALKDKIHDIHNFLRNNGAGYGMNALKVFNVLYGLKKIEENGLIDKINLKRPECEFSYLLKIATKNKHEKLVQTIIDDVLDSISESPIRDLLFYEIPKKIRGDALAFLIKEINNITLIEKKCNVLLSGKIYEYFIGRDATAISELGAYFTDRHIVDFIYDRIQPTLNDDNTVKTMIDMFGGSGGFTTGYIDYLIKSYPDYINWKKEINKIYHYDMNEDVIKSAGLELFCLTGKLPNMRNNMLCANSFTEEFDDMKYDYVITNPPYGGDKMKQTIAQIKRNKIRDYILNELKTLKDDEIIKNRKKQLQIINSIDKQEKNNKLNKKVSVRNSSMRIQKFAYDHKLTGNDKESTSLILMMDMLNVGGTCVGVLKEGVFFNRVYKNLRECLVKNFNVKEVISVPQDQFENTSTKTSIIIFENTKEKTQNVKFSNLIIERYAEDVFKEIDGNIVLTENKGDISEINCVQSSIATIEEICKNPIFSLNGHEYKKSDLVCGDNYEMVKIGNICEFLPKSTRHASFGQKTGKYNFYTSSTTIQYCDVVDYNNKCIIIGTGGHSCIHLAEKFSCSADTLLLTSINFDIEIIYNGLKIMWETLMAKMSGSTIKHVTKDLLRNFAIPVPKTEQLTREIKNKISKQYNEIYKLRKEIYSSKESYNDTNYSTVANTKIIVSSKEIPKKKINKKKIIVTSDSDEEH